MDPPFWGDLGGGAQPWAASALVCHFRRATQTGTPTARLHPEGSPPVACYESHISVTD